MKAMRRPEFTPSISLGNIITLGMGVMAMAVGWGVIQTKVTHLENFQERSEERITARMEAQADFNKHMDERLRIVEKRSAQTKSSGLQSRVRKLEDMSARTDERYGLILTMMSELKNQVGALTNARMND